MSDIGARKKTLLRAVIIEYVTGAEPVSSEFLTQKYDLGVKSATIRNELADLSEQGFLEQPHTSAGRIPSDQGYRYYVDHIVRDYLSEFQQASKANQQSDPADPLHNLLQGTTSFLSRYTHLLSAATAYSSANLSVRSVIVSAIGPQQILLVLVLSNGHVENALIEAPLGVSLEDIGLVNIELNELLHGTQVHTIHRIADPSHDKRNSHSQLLSNVLSQIKLIVKGMQRGTLVTEGKEFLIGEPEFRKDAIALNDLLDTLSTETELMNALIDSPDQTGTVSIGRENKSEKLHRLSIVKQRFYCGDQEAGTIAIIGPTRMSYEKSIPLINTTAAALSDSLTKFFG